ncbi:MAG: MarR family transcriptional regulator [Myxococcota bacterium]
MSDLHDVALHLDRLMRRVGARLHAAGEEIDPDGVGPIGGMILTTLAEIEPAPVRDIVDLMQRDKSQMTRALKMLESRGLIKRQPSSDDRRVQLVSLTSKGRKKVDVIRHVMSDIVEELLAPLSTTERRKFATLLRKL